MEEKVRAMWAGLWEQQVAALVQAGPSAAAEGAQGMYASLSAALGKVMEEHRAWATVGLPGLVLSRWESTVTATMRAV